MRRTHIHVRQQGYINQRYPLLFKDYLIANNCVRASYAIIKQQLAEVYPNSIDGYLSIKDPVMDIIYQGAEAWGQQTHWQPSSDFY